MKKRKFMKKTSSILLVVLPVLMVLNIYCSIPGEIRLTEHSSCSMPLKPFCSVTTEPGALAASSKTTEAMVSESNDALHLNAGSSGDYNLSLKLFDAIPVKTIHVSVEPKTYVVPSGSPIGVKLYTKGLLIVSISDVTAADGVTKSPGKDAGLKTGDRILAVNGKTVSTTEDFSATVNDIQAAITLTVAREDATFDVSVTPVLAKDENKFKLGIWVRDSTAGIGTLTFYNPENTAFGALGHAITDVDTGNIMEIDNGSILSCNIISITKGASGAPGELTGSFSNEYLGKIKQNTELGLYGTLSAPDAINAQEPIEVATRFQTKEGPAYILADVNGNGVKKYSVEIEKVSKSSGIDNKGIVLKITDPVLLEETGGIVQGMSGAPIIQNNMLIGAVTHVFVNDPQRGYGIFAENMLDMTNNLE